MIQLGSAHQGVALNTDELFLLAGPLRGDRDLAGAARQCLYEVAQSAEYQAWHLSLAQARPFEIPARLDAGVLQSLGIAEGRELQTRVNWHGGHVFLTDGVWVDPKFRVFPYSDESAVLLAQASRLGWDEEAAVVIDLAGGCGHTPWSLKSPLQLLLDINPRALAYADLNKLLNGLDPQRYLSGLSDIRSGIPLAHACGAKDSVLVVANMPFAPAPDRGSMPLTSNGGEDGMDLQLATFRALARLRQRVPPSTRIRALVLGLSVGSAAQDRWKLQQSAAQFFGERAHWHTLREHELLRIDGARAARNPSPVDFALPAIADCTLFTPDPAARPGKRASFTQLAALHQAQGNPDLAYGLVTLELD